MSNEKKTIDAFIKFAKKGYKSKLIDYVCTNGYKNYPGEVITIPIFLAEIDWEEGFLLALKKWRETCCSLNKKEVVIDFYSVLSDTDKEKFITWIFKNI